MEVSGESPGKAPRSSLKRKRAKQTETWLRAHYPPPLPTMVRLVKKLDPGEFGKTTLNDARFTVTVDVRLSEAMLLETLIHEWAHVLTYAWVKVPHGDEYWLQYGRIYRRWHYQGGHQASRGL